LLLAGLHIKILVTGPLLRRAEGATYPWVLCCISAVLQTQLLHGELCLRKECSFLSQALTCMQALFSALNGGEVRKLSLVDLANPFGAAWKNVRRARKAVTDHNMKVSSAVPLVVSVLLNMQPVPSRGCFVTSAAWPDHGEPCNSVSWSHSYATHAA
jgi:hypothetical protein